MMNTVKLESTKNFIKNIFVSNFDNSSNCLIVHTEEDILIYFVNYDKEINLSLYKIINIDYQVNCISISPVSRTFIEPYVVKLICANNNSVFSVDNNNEMKQTIIKGDFEVSSMCYNNDGDKLAFTGYDKKCHILIYQSDCLSDADSMIYDAVSEGSYNHITIKLTSNGQIVKWHPVMINSLIVAEMNGVIRFLCQIIDDDDRETFICDYYINVGYSIGKPLNDLDFILNTTNDRICQVLLASSTGLYTFAMEKPIQSLKKLKTFSDASGNEIVKICHTIGSGTLLATIGTNQSLILTDLARSKTLACSPIESVSSISWCSSKPYLLATNYNTIYAYKIASS